MPKFRKKPVVIEAMQWTGENADAVVQWAQGGWGVSGKFMPAGRSIWIKQLVVDPEADPIVCVWRLVIPTLEGDHEANPGDWIIRGVKGEFYPIKDEIFCQTYDSADADGS